MVFTDLCPPALIYLLFSITQVVIDTVKGLYNTALIKIWVAIIFTILLNYLCQSGLGIISWLIVFIPFILMTLVVSILLLMFGLDPSTGKIKLNKQGNHKHHSHGKKCDSRTDNDNEDCSEDESEMEKDKILDYYNKYLKGNAESGGGGSITSDEVESLGDKKENDKKILEKSFLFYSTKENDVSTKIQGKSKNDDTSGAAEYNNENAINETKYKLFVDDITNMLYGMGEQDMASWFKNKSTRCLNNLNSVKKDLKQLKIEECFQDILDELMSKFNNNKKNLFKKNYRERVCQINETLDVCKNRVVKGWWQ